MTLREGVRTVVAGSLVTGLVVFAVSCQTNRERADAEATRAADSLRALRLDRGQQAYLANCAMCHGESGAGDGPLAAELQARDGSVPTHLNDRARLDRIGREEIVRVISRGGAHTGRSNLMPPWGERLGPAVIDTIADYVMALPDIAPGTPASTIEKYLAAPAGSPAEGRRLFVFYCTICHGPFGKGDGIMADTLRARNKIAPRDLTDSVYFARKTDQELYVTVAMGGAHSGKSMFMPAWTVTLPPEHIKDLVSYVRAISGTSPRP